MSNNSIIPQMTDEEKRAWQNIYEHEPTKNFKKDKPDQLYRMMEKKFFPICEAAFRREFGDDYEIIDENERISFVCRGNEEFQTASRFIKFERTVNRGGFELFFHVKEKKTGMVFQTLCYFAPTGELFPAWVMNDRERDFWADHPDRPTEEAIARVEPAPEPKRVVEPAPIDEPTGWGEPTEETPITRVYGE